MKISMGKKLLMLAHWLCSLLVCAALAASMIAPGFAAGCLERLRGSVGSTGTWIIGIAALALYGVLAALQLCAILGRRKRVEKGFITVGSSDAGHVRISIAAVEQMVRQSVHSIEGISEMKIGIDSADDALIISVNAVIVNGSHVPTITTNMQRSIRQFVELNCGVAVHEVSISINAVASQPEGARRRFGRGKPAPFKARPEAGKPAWEPSRAPLESEGTADETIVPERATDVESPEQTALEEPEEAAQPEAEGERAAAYDFDKPYESQFEKDLAAMRAREDAGAAGERPERDGD